MAKQKSGAPAAAGQVNIIGQGVVIEGTVTAKNDVRIGGRIIGNVNVEGRTVVTPEGEVEGEVRSRHADIAGRINGQVLIQERLVLKSTAVVEGDIHTGKLVIEDGASFSGKCDMSGTLPQTGQKAGRKPTALPEGKGANSASPSSSATGSKPGPGSTSGAGSTSSSSPSSSKSSAA
ncbi:MAG: polymer-forming cytoskeletal protein [Rhodothermales bacterium]|nr:polymer-forming cytoskeletal protein [Rhodothermales bacterium]